MGEKRFPIQGGPSVPWRMIEPYRDMADCNHGQTLERLAQRGGLGPGELRAIVECKTIREAEDAGLFDRDSDNVAWVKEWIHADAYRAGVEAGARAQRERCHEEIWPLCRGAGAAVLMVHARTPLVTVEDLEGE
jgi:hypothetical protein